MLCNISVCVLLELDQNDLQGAVGRERSQIKCHDSSGLQWMKVSFPVVELYSSLIVLLNHVVQQLLVRAVS
jgi:hypothetical protein